MIFTILYDKILIKDVITIITYLNFNLIYKINNVFIIESQFFRNWTRSERFFLKNQLIYNNNVD